MSFIKKLWSDDAGFVVTSELILVGTVLVIGLTIGLTSLRDQVVQELADLAISIGSVNESYSYSGITGHTSSVAGSIFEDNFDYCEEDSDPVTSAAACIRFNVPAAPEAL
ncbi:MAG: hypothetical protein O2955_12950 [Planctomycetota bacterium]|nr:hypothetical protein [Planctomycetota bacterium]